MPFPSVATIKPILLAVLALMVLASAAQAHPILDTRGLKAPPLNSFIGGLVQPLLSPNHPSVLLSLFLVGLCLLCGWMLAPLVCRLGDSALRQILPGLPGAEAPVAFSLAAVGVVLLGVLPQPLLLPAMALHGDMLCASLIGCGAAWTWSGLVG